MEEEAGRGKARSRKRTVSLCRAAPLLLVPLAGLVLVGLWEHLLRCFCPLEEASGMALLPSQAEGWVGWAACVSPVFRASFSRQVPQAWSCRARPPTSYGGCLAWLLNQGPRRPEMAPHLHRPASVQSPQGQVRALATRRARSFFPIPRSWVRWLVLGSRRCQQGQSLSSPETEACGPQRVSGPSRFWGGSRDPAHRFLASLGAWCPHRCVSGEWERLLVPGARVETPPARSWGAPARVLRSTWLSFARVPGLWAAKPGQHPPISEGASLLGGPSRASSSPLPRSLGLFGVQKVLPAILGLVLQGHQSSQ